VKVFHPKKMSWFRLMNLEIGEVFDAHF